MTTTNKGLIQPANGSYVDTWDQPVNNDWSYIDTAFGGAVSLNATGISAHTLTLTEYRPLIIEVTGAISNNVVYTIPSGIGGQWIVINNTTDATGGPWTISFTCAGSGYSISCPRATTTNLMCDGVNVNFADGRPGSPGGSNTQVQYNNNGTLAGSSNFVFTGTNVGIGTSSPAGKLDILTGTNRGYFDDSAGSLFRLNAVNAANSAYAPLSLNGSVLTFQITGTECARIDSSGNVGIGTTSPSARLNILSAGGWTSSNWGKGFYVNTSGFACNPAIGISDYTGSNNWAIVNLSGALTFNTAPAITDSTTAGVEAMRIDSSGNLLVGYTSSNGAYKLQVNSQIFATSSTIATSDARYKQNVETLNGALSLVKALRPVSFNWKKHPVHDFDTENTTVGFLAQEVQQVLADKPYLNSIIKKNECVIEPEVKDENGDVTTAAVTEEFLGIAEGNMIAILTSALQELSAKVAALEANATKVA